MKKRKLKLSRETLRSLTEKETALAVGAEVSVLCTATSCSVNATCLCKCTNKEIPS